MGEGGSFPDGHNSSLCLPIFSWKKDVFNLITVQGVKRFRAMDENWSNSSFVYGVRTMGLGPVQTVRSRLFGDDWVDESEILSGRTVVTSMSLSSLFFRVFRVGGFAHFGYSTYNLEIFA